VINPVMFIEAVKATNPEGQITDLTGTIVSVNVAGNSFLTQGPLGHQFTVDVDGNTNYNAGFTLATLPTSGVFVSLQGTVQMDGSILASDVEFVTTDLAFTSGRILAHRQLARLGHGFAECLLCQARASTHGRCGRSLIRRTAVCGPACTVVWQGRRGDPSPYADFEAL
jgi:hypothetical protein